ncbi:MAG: hypothetical protein ABSC90_12465 [Acidimicrobiales bacterium]|jgi:hypothetical protein
MLAAGMVFMVEWNPLVHHLSSWATPGDLWGMVRAAHYVQWGFLGGIYTPSNGIVTFPGMAILLSPAAWLSENLHLTESFLPFFLPRPTAAFVFEPLEILLAATVVFASDALAEHLGVSHRRRIALCVSVGVLAWPTAAVWGHAEDALAMTFALYALVALMDGRWSGVGWLLGVGIVIQPLVALLVPLVVAAAPSGRRVAVTVRSAVISVFLVGVAFAGDAKDTYRALVTQPTPPSVNHATPWVGLAPRVSSGGGPISHAVTVVPGLGHPVLTATTASSPVTLVSGGPGRLIDILLILLLSFYVWRRPQPPVTVLWLAALVLASRCFFEAVMTPYYLAPPLMLALVMTARLGARRFWTAAILSLELSVFAYHHLEPWVWWLPIVSGLSVILALGYPGPHRAVDTSVEDEPVATSQPDLRDGPGRRPLESIRREHDDELASV